MTLRTYFGLPKKIIFCKKSLISNQRPNSSIEFNHNKKSKKKTLAIDKHGISDSWKYSRIKLKIDYGDRKKKITQTFRKT